MITHSKQLCPTIVTSGVGSSSGTPTPPFPTHEKPSVSSGALGEGQAQEKSVGLSSSRLTLSSSVATPSGAFRSGVLRVTPCVAAPASVPGRRGVHTARGGMVEAKTSRSAPRNDALPKPPRPQKDIATRSYPAPADVFPTIFSSEGRPPSDGPLEAAASPSRGTSPCVIASSTFSDVVHAASPNETEPMAELVRLARDSYDRPRRLLVSPSLGLLSATMRGAVTIVDRDPPRSAWWLFHWFTHLTLCRRARVLRAAVEGSREAVDDTCLLSRALEEFMVAAHAREDHQLSLMHITGGNEVGHGVCLAVDLLE